MLISMHVSQGRMIKSSVDLDIVLNLHKHLIGNNLFVSVNISYDIDMVMKSYRTFLKFIIQSLIKLCEITIFKVSWLSFFLTKFVLYYHISLHGRFISWLEIGVERPQWQQCDEMRCPALLSLHPHLAHRAVYEWIRPTDCLFWKLKAIKGTQHTA